MLTVTYAMCVGILQGSDKSLHRNLLLGYTFVSSSMWGYTVYANLVLPTTTHKLKFFFYIEHFCSELLLFLFFKLSMVQCRNKEETWSWSWWSGFELIQIVFHSAELSAEYWPTFFGLWEETKVPRDNHIGRKSKLYPERSQARFAGLRTFMLKGKRKPLHHCAALYAYFQYF